MFLQGFDWRSNVCVCVYREIKATARARVGES